MKPRFFATIENGKLRIEKNSLGKFHNDEVDIDNDDYRVIMQGVIFNKSQLCNNSTMSSYILDNLYSGKFDFFNHIRGNFNGIIFNKHNKELTAFTDHFGTNALYYYNGGGGR